MVNGVRSLREEAVSVAFRHFAASGSLSMRQVADELDVTATALYHHFANKQALLDAVADRAFSDFDKRLRTTNATEPEEIVWGILDGYRQFAADQPNLFGLMFVDARRSARKFPADFAAHRSAVFNLLWKAVGECLADDGPGDQDEALYLAHDLWALTHGQIMLWRAGRFVDEPEFRKVLSRAIDHFLDNL